MYYKKDIERLTTGELARAYQKLDSVIVRRAGGCWEHKNVKVVLANQHRLVLSVIPQSDGSTITEFVKTVQLIRHRYGYSIEESDAYGRTCNNPYCFNPAHQLINYERNSGGRPRVSDDNVLKCKEMRRYGWTAKHQKEVTSAGAYRLSLLDNPSVDIGRDGPVNINISVLEKIANVYNTVKTPTFQQLLDATGLSYDELLPYGVAEAAISARSTTPESAAQTLQVIKYMAMGYNNLEIAHMVNELTTKITGFRGSLYG